MSGLNHNLDVIIPCRLNSSRLSEKMLCEVRPNIPLIVETYFNTLEAFSPYLQSFNVRFYVAIDSPKISTLLEKFDIPYIYTSDTHLGGISRCYEAASILNSNFIVVVQGDEPCITTNYIAPILNRFRNIVDSQELWDVITLFTYKNSSENSVFLVTDIHSKVLYMSRLSIPFSSYQLERKVHIGIYLFTIKSLENYQHIKCSLSNCENIEILKMVTNDYRVYAERVLSAQTRIGIDTISDLTQYKNLVSHK